jgi:alpha-L-fucosidase 2
MAASSACSRLCYTRGMRFAMCRWWVVIFVMAGACYSEAASVWPLDVAGVVSRSDIVLSSPNSLPAEALPLGNGRLGIAAWAAEGFTAQLNRADTLPHRDSPGQFVIPSLAALDTAKDFSGRLDLYHGSLIEHGNGITLLAYVQTSTDSLIVDVSGVDPEAQQTASLRLWEPRKPQATASGGVGQLAESWVDHYGPGASGENFASLAAVTAVGRDVSAAVSGERSVTVTFKPEADGHFRVIVAAPHDHTELDKALANTNPAEHEAWWHSFWSRAGLIKITSQDGSGEYMENLRNLYLFTSAAESGSRFPGSQAGIADLFSAVEDTHHWDPAAFWHWNLRMQVAANIDAGVPELNAPYFRLYRENLASIEDWTKQHMGGRPGICIPETMRFNGYGYEYEAEWDKTKPAVVGLNCDADSKPYYNARTISTGSEVSLWIWQQYLATGDREFLAANYPVMKAATEFLLAYESTGADGKKHTHPSNAHEQQWDTIDPVTDLSARLTLFPAVVQAAGLLHTDSELVEQLKAEAALIPPLPEGEKNGVTVIVESHDPNAKAHNEENLGLEPVWPYGLIGDDSPMLALAKSTFATRPYPVHQDWCFDPVQAARLGLRDEVRSTLIALTERYQKYINGFAAWGGPAGEFYIEQEGVVALALAEALVQDYDGLIRISPSTPLEWDFDGTVWVRDRTGVSVQVRNGVPVAVVIEAGGDETLRIRNPWPGKAVKVGEAEQSGSVLTLPVRNGESYLLAPAGATATLEAVTGTAASGAKKLGPVQIGK